jgi:hypothetical protein
MRPALSLFAALALVASAQTATAQPGPRPDCPACRGLVAFRTCALPAAGALAFSGKALRVDGTPCRPLLYVEVLNSAELGLPTSIKVDLGRCAAWTGKIGDTLDVAVGRKQRAHDGAFPLACRHW